MDQFYNGTRGCPCRPACLEENYPASVSSVKWPNEKHQVDQPLRTSLVFPKETAANAFGMEIESVPENLVKINVYYTSLNEKTIEDEIVYSVKVREFELKSEFTFLKILQSTGWELVQCFGWLSLSLAWRLILQPL